jgi:trehalose utilization protein
VKDTIRVTVWNEFRHEKSHEAVRKVYPEGLHAAIAGHLNKQAGMKARLAALDDPEHGLTEAVLGETDVLIWWGHMAHHEVKDEVVDRVQARVLGGMGLIVLHSGHFSKIFRRLMGTECNLWWREINEKARYWVVAPNHPIAAGLGPYFELPHEEMYGEFFDIPQPDELVFIAWFAGGEVFRAGCCYKRGHGRVFYFQPGHETYPSYHDAHVLRAITNAVQWAAPDAKMVAREFGHRPKPIEKLA